MKKVIIPDGHSGRYDASKSNRDYILAKGSELHSGADTITLFEGNAHSGNLFHINGIVENTFAPDGIAMAFVGSGTNVTIGKSADITGLSGAVWMIGVNQALVNNGEIEAGVFGIRASDAKSIVNNGYILADTGIDLIGQSKVTNNGEIDADVAGIRWTDGAGTLTLGKNSDIASVADSGDNGVGISRLNDTGVASRTVNEGQVLGTNFAFQGDAGNETLVNRGAITGLVSLGDGDDTFDNLGGTLTGDVDGGAGNDTYFMGKTIFNIIEGADAAGSDTIRSTVTRQLDAEWNVEDLYLIGKKNIDGFGDAGDNHIFGNKGRNVLGGLAGNDEMTGGAGKDIFQFRTGDDIDTIMDFRNGIDKIDLSGFDTYTSFADLVAKEAFELIDGNVHIIDVNAMGEELTLVGVKLGQLDKSDFIF